MINLITVFLGYLFQLRARCGQCAVSGENTLFSVVRSCLLLVTHIVQDMYF
ncbi:MAG: hypothetical protein IJV56_11015 [Neisseriaceae bacterium]|nr:hypothetical protein [Neisseriaceae bacterium]